MALSLRLNLESANVSDLEALLAAARASGVSTSAQVSLEGTHLVIETDEPQATTTTSAHQSAAQDSTGPNSDSKRTDFPVGQVGDAAIRTVIDILSGRQNPQDR